ncbi:recombinase family protein [Cryobacterium sp. GrIS_2_6]|uniref:recombinase family protein n=1 Tax=Cryobacterium sp. GrIS_2_6 TaxID=3162785 RepID=UPI002DFCF521|nr:recombinase family protein [Cryobacterium psychrotolerans]MEC5150894.1 DNA invertase Pin-like site-specific DNA recombinase [Cryobacterium psychrotolerans]
MSKVVAYVRVSTNHQDHENQRYEITQFAVRQGLEISEYVAEVITGKAAVKDRKIGDLLASLEDGDTLVVSEVSRISRSLTAVLTTIEDATKRGVTIMTVKGGHVFGDNINSKVIAFAFGLAAEIERDLISARTKEALARKKAEGVILGRPVGSHTVENLKLWGKDEEILTMMMKRVPKSAIARLLDVNRNTLSAYIERRELVKELLWRRHNQIKN